MMKDDCTGSQEKTSRLPRSSEWQRLVFFTVIYWLTARMGLLFVLQPEGVASLWPVSGLALATLLWVEERDRGKYFATIGAANFLANFTGGNTAAASLGFAAANVAEAALGWWTFCRIAGRPKGFSSIKEVWALVAAAIFANGLTALLGAAVPHLAFGAPYWATWRLWWVADGLGMMLISPLLICWAAWRRILASPPTFPRLIEGAAIILFTFVTILYIFRILPTDIPIINRPYALFLLVVWMAIQFEARGVSCISLLISIFFLGNLANPFGIYPWDEVTKLSKLVQTQGYLMMLSAVGLFVAASVSSIRESGKSLQREKESLRESEEELRWNQAVIERLAQEMAIIAEIGKVVGSTLDTEEIYESFAAEVRKLILFDRLSVNLHDLDQGIVTTVYVSGESIPGRKPGDAFPLKGSVSEVLVRTKAGMFSHPLSVEEMDKRFPDHSATIQAGMRSLLSVPLISRDEVIASLHFRSKSPNAYTEQDLRLAERIGEQIAGAIANAQLYAGLKETEEELKESEQRYRELSIIDDLTQLYNSRHFYVQLKSETERSNRYGQPLTLLLLDLDNFKAFNDAYGHVEGDQVLSRLGQVVKRCLRETDSAYRYGGEEFTILLPMTTSGEGVVTAERIRTEFRKETFSPAPGQEVHMTLSIGLAQYRTKEEVKAFVHRVDQWMYQGKKNGKDRVCCES
jgi:diguanylate cyclase (GGDEF)-like protein